MLVKALACNVTPVGGYSDTVDLPACAESNTLTLTASSPLHQLHCLTPQKILKDFSRHTLAT
jgi:hypothetical protein